MSDNKQESINEGTNKWNSYRIKDTSQYPDIWFYEVFNINLNLKKIEAKYEKDKDEMKVHIFDVLPEKYKPVRVSSNVNI